jgi:hypothetical protein
MELSEIRGNNVIVMLNNRTSVSLTQHRRHSHIVGFQVLTAVFICSPSEAKRRFGVDCHFPLR